MDQITFKTNIKKLVKILSDVGLEDQDYVGPDFFQLNELEDFLLSQQSPDLYYTFTTVGKLRQEINDEFLEKVFKEIKDKVQSVIYKYLEAYYGSY